MPLLTFGGMDGSTLDVNVPAHQPLQVGLDAYAQQHMLPGALFENETRPPHQPAANFSGGVTAQQNKTLRLLLDGERIQPYQTPAQRNLEDGDVIDVFLGQGGGPACYPDGREVFNTVEGALAYYQQEVRTLRAASHSNLIDPATGVFSTHVIDEMRQQNTQLLQQNAQLRQQNAQLTQDEAQQHAQHAQEKAAATVESGKLRERVSTLERLRKSDLEALRALRREKRAEEQKLVREEQLAKLRSHIRRVPVTGTQALNVAVAVTPGPALSRRSPRVSAS